MVQILEFCCNVCQKLACPATKYAIASSHFESDLGFVSGSCECISMVAIAAHAGVDKPYSIIQNPKLIHLH
ncbi:hypothetical protein PQG02_12690 [Nostoc sp. UHCC 0926]|uniref:hypothetical protein n=1 Tax=unclassified Nostoc TaxID=2593658 RepID=UPI0023611855|nr:hypothetical protein [Nostoc sp. UHCC 0926]WDD35116.1 hypothetical protein PQG02_12690 [Nostoc sp. UHCC 0926]